MSDLASRGGRMPCVCLALACAACASDAADDDDVATGADAAPGECPAEGRYLPLLEGASWTYRVTDLGDGSTGTKTHAVGAAEAMDGAKAGITAFRVTTTRPGGTTVSWQEDTGDAVVRHRELDMAGATQTDERYEPYKLRLDESAAHVAAGAAFSEQYTEVVIDMIGSGTTDTTKTEMWSVIAVDEPVAVPAGTFCALRVRRVTSTTLGGSDKTYWFARGVGKVKEEGGNQREELTDHALP